MFPIFLKFLLLLMLWPGVGKSREPETELCTKFKRFQPANCSEEDPLACREQFMTENQLSPSEIEQLNQCASEKSEPEPESRKKRFLSKAKEMGSLIAATAGEMAGSVGGIGDATPPPEEPPASPSPTTLPYPQPVAGQPGTQASQSPPSPPVTQKSTARFQEVVKAAQVKAKETMHTKKTPPESLSTPSPHPSSPKKFKTVAQAVQVHPVTRKKKEQHESEENQHPKKDQRIAGSKFKRVALTARANNKITQPSTKHQPPSTKKH